MKLKAYVPDPLNEQASVLVDAQTDIKTAIKQGVLSGAPFLTVKKSVQKIIDFALAKIRSPTLKEDARISLMQFADGAYGRFRQNLASIPTALIPAVVVLMRGVTDSGQKNGVYYPKTKTERKALNALQSLGNLQSNAIHVHQNGLPLDEFHKTYMKRVESALDGLSEENALDPNDFTGRNSLRNLAEMQVRYERHQEEIAGFKARGTKLVVCSVHADCSDRCAPWQGGVYSLDGTSGTTEDGRKYQPLENATDIFYTTKAGRTYKNGLLGFNCRHKLFEYKTGMEIPTVSEAEQKREYAITNRQREMERAVVSAREMALSYKDTGCPVVNRKGEIVINPKTGKPLQASALWRNIAIERNNAYKQFSREHDRAYYPDRVKIL